MNGCVYLLIHKKFMKKMELLARVSPLWLFAVMPPASVYYPIPSMILKMLTKYGVKMDLVVFNINAVLMDGSMKIFFLIGSRIYSL